MTTFISVGPIRITKDDIADYIGLYSPLQYRVDPTLPPIPPHDDLSRTSAPQTRYNFTSYATSLKRCYELVEKPYDAFIILRSDAIPILMPDPSPTHILVWDRLPSRKNVLDVIVCSVPARYIETYVSLVDYLDIYYHMGYVFNYEELMHAHFHERGLYDAVLRLPKHNFEWQYIRGNTIEKM